MRQKMPFVAHRQTDYKTIRREIDTEWEQFVIKGGETERVRPVIVESWRRCRDVYQVNSKKETPARLSEEELLIQQEQNEVLHLARPVFDELTNMLKDTGDLITFYNAEGWQIEMQGDPELVQGEGRQYLGLNFQEKVIGTNGAGTTLAERRPVQVLASEHYWDVFHTWSGYGAPVLDPISHEPLAVLGIAGHEVVGYPHTLLTVAMAARAIEQRIKQMQIIKDQQIIGEGSRQAAGRLNDGLLAIDQRGRVLQMNAAASHLLRVPETTRTLDACPHLNEVVSSFLHRTILPVSPEEYQIYYPQTDHYLTTTIAPVVRDKCVIGVIVLLSHPQERSGTSLHRNPTETLARRGNSKWVRAKYSFEHILGGVAEVKQALRLAKLAATNTLSVLIAGESGTGKEMVAQAIHNASQRAHMPFIVVNCGAIPEELIEAEFFGYEAGAFTGARRGGSAGKFESADGGTIFLDEVTELSPSGQVALLRVLQEMEIVRLGSHLPTVIDVRVIAATNRDLRHEVETRRFRADLYYRLNVLSIELPPLRERRDDIPHLTDSILQSVAIQLGQQRFALSPEALNVLMAYDWPGNIRELKNVLERAAALSEGLILGIENLPPTLTSRQKRNPLGHGETGWTATRAFHERELLLKILTECSGNVSEAARRLSVSRKTLQRKMKKYQVSSQKTIS